MPVRLVGTLVLLLPLLGCTAPAREDGAVAGGPPALAPCRPARDAAVVLWSCRIEPDGRSEVRELSGIYYDRDTATLWAASDESRPDADGAARLLELGLTPEPAVAIRGVRRLTREPGPAGGDAMPNWQPEAIAPEIAGGRWTGAFFLASERDNWSPSLVSQIYRCADDGVCRVAFQLPTELQTRAGASTPAGMSDNQGMEGLTVSPDGSRLFAALERPLLHEAPDGGRRARVRLLEFAPGASTALRQYAYELDPLPRNVSVPSGSPGVSEILAASNRDLLVMERSYSAGCGNTIRVFQVTLDTSLALVPGQTIARGSPLRKRLLVDLTDEKSSFDDEKLSRLLENFEGMTFGPALPDGSPTLLLVSDDNARSDQITSLIGLRMASLPTAAARRWRDGDAPVCPGTPRQG